MDQYDRSPQPPHEQPKPAMLEYAAASPPRRPFSVPIAVITAVAGGFLIAVLVLVVPTFEAIYSDFRVELPAITLLVLAASRAFAQGLWIVLIAPAALLPFAALKGERAERITIRLIVVLFFLGMGFIVLALFSPMVGLIQQINGP